MITRLEVREFTVDDDGETHSYEPGYRWTHFYDPLTGKFYMPKSTFVVTGDNLEDLFEEVIE